MKISKRRLGKIVEVVFDDHAMNSPIIECCVWGKLIHIDEKCIVVKSWECDKENHADPNNEMFTILRSAISSFKALT